MYLKFLHHTEQRAKEGTESKNYTSTTNVLKHKTKKYKLERLQIQRTKTTTAKLQITNANIQRANSPQS